LGTNENFKRLCEKAKEKGIDIILDGVFSHTGSDSIYFNSKGRYNSIGAYNSQQSPYYNWYTFQSFPNSYSCWWGFISLPEVNELNQNFSNYICGENGVIDYWIKQGAKGFRLDVADELPDEFIQKIKSRIKSIDNENLLIGEVWEDATNKESYGKFRKYLLGKELDSVMNYPFKDSILEFVRFKNAKLFSNKVMTIIENYPKPALDVAMNSLSTHDTVRALTNLAGADCQGKDRIWQFKNFLSPSEYDLGIKMLKISMVLQYFLPGVPCIYYGDEAGVQGYKDPFNRSCFPWGNENKELMTFTKELGRLRLSLDVLIDGGCRFISSDDGIVIFERFKDKEKIVITVDVNNYTFSVKQGD
jgi:glycosidase